MDNKQNTDPSNGSGDIFGLDPFVIAIIVLGAIAVAIGYGTGVLNIIS